MELRDESAELIIKYLSLIQMSTKNKNIIELAERCLDLVRLPFVADQLKKMANENKTKENKDAIIENLKYERDSIIREKETILEAFNVCIKELEEIRKRFMVLTSKKVQDFIEQVKEDQNGR